MNAVLQRDFTDLRLSVAGIIFLGAPFQGSDAAYFGKWVARLRGLDPTMLELLEKGSPELYALATDFWGSYSDSDIVCFYEKLETDYGPLESQVCLCLALQGSHVNRLRRSCARNQPVYLESERCSLMLIILGLTSSVERMTLTLN